MTQLFRNKSRTGAGAFMPATRLDDLVGSIQRELNINGAQFASKQVARAALSLESLNETDAVAVDSVVETLSHALEGMCTELKIEGMSPTQKTAGVVAGIIASDVHQFLRTPVRQNIIATENMSVVSVGGADHVDGRLKQALEAYDEKENKNAVTYSVAYNMQAARQDEFGEAFFPTVVVTPDQVGFTVSIRLVQVYNEQRRQISGKLEANFGKKNIIQAVIDPTILRNDATKIVPVFRDESKAMFVSETLMPPRAVLLEGESITTSALAVGKNLSLLGISQTEALIETGLMDSTDSLDTAIALEAIYVKIPGATEADARVLRFNTGRLPLATFAAAVQGNYRQMNLQFRTDSLLVSKSTKDVAGAPVAKLAPLVSGEFQVRLGVKVSGEVNLEIADTNVYASNITVERVLDIDGNQLPLDAGNGKTMADLFAGAVVVGYDLDARRTNVNRRERGQLLDTTFYNQVYAVPLRSPITVPRPLTIGDANDSSDLAALITATHIRTSNAAVEELLRVQDFLAEFVSAKDTSGIVPEILGVARFLVKPYFEHFVLNVNDVIDSLKSHERAEDIQAVLVNKMRDMAYRMYRDSGYKAAADALAGGMTTPPTVIVGTDPVLSRYLTVTGDLRTLGNDFNIKIVSTLNRRMTGKIIMTFGEFGQGKEGVPNPMHFGNMAWKPELTLVLPLHRNGANSKELTVQPSFLHVTNLPILAVIDVEGIEDVVAAKVPLNMQTVA
jgi:hypothetical protein